jgi:hypothetical protein
MKALAYILNITGSNGLQNHFARVAIDAFRSGLASHAAYPSLAIDLPVSNT